MQITITIFIYYKKTFNAACLFIEKVFSLHPVK